MSRNNRPESADEAMEAMAALVRQLHSMQGARGAGGDPAGAELLASLGAGGGMMMGGGGAASEALLTKMKNDADEGEQVSALNDFCMDLSMGRGDAFNPQKFVPVLMSCMQKTHNPNIPLLAARGLTYFVDNTPRSVEVILRMGFLSTILGTLREIADMELAEQTVTCVSNICKVAPQAVLEADGLSAVLGFIDFFSIVTQRTILSIVADVTRKFRKDHMALVQPVLAQIRNYIVADDNKMAEFALTAMIRMVQNTSSDPDIVYQVFDGSSASLVDVLNKRPSEAIFSAALQLLSAAASKSAKVAKELIKLNAVSALVGIVEPQKQQASSSVSGGGSSPSGPSSPNSATKTTTTAKTLGTDRLKDITKCLLGFAPAVEGDANIVTHVAKVSTLPPSQSPVRRTVEDMARGGGRGGFQGSVADVTRRLQMQHASLAHQGGGGGVVDGDSGMEDEDYDDDDGMMMDDEDSDEEYEDMDEGDEDTLDNEEVKALAQQLISEGRIKIENNLTKHTQCHPGRHLCDKCEQTIQDTDMWYRCNTRGDFDICARCLVKDDVLESEAASVFTHMSAVFPSVLQRIGGRRPPFGAGEEEESTTPCENQNDALVRLIKESPEMIQLLSAALPCLSRLAVEVEDAETRNFALDFICRLLHYSSSECLVATLHDTPLCEAVTSLIANPSLVVQTRCVFIVGTLIQKLPQIYLNLFIREGVTNGLVVLKSNVSVDARTEASTASWNARLKHEGTWKALLASEAADLLVIFASADDCGRLSHLETLRNKLDDQSPDASPLISVLSELVAALADVSTFELMHSGIITSILGALGRADSPPLVLVELVTRLSACPGDDQQQGTLLTKLVHMLQSIIAQAEQFKKPSFEKDDKDIILSLNPHDPKELEEQISASAARQHALAKHLKKKEKHSKKDKAGTANDNDGALPLPPVVSGSSSSSSSVAHPLGGEDTKALLKELAANADPATAGETKKGVRIDAQASIEGVANFVLNTLLPSKPDSTASSPAGSTARSARASPTTRADDVMMVDPFEGEQSPAGSPAGSPTTPSAPTLPAKTTVYIRYKRTALPLTMTMSAAMKAYVNTDPDRSIDSKILNEEMGLGFSALMGMGVMRSREIVQLHYSTEPFTFPTVTNPEVYIKGGNPNSPTTVDPVGGDVVQYNPENLPTAGSLALAAALSSTSFERSRSLNIPDALLDAIRLITVIFDACTQWESLVRWVVIHKADPEAWQRYPAPNVTAEEFTSQKLSNKALQHGATKEAVGQQWGTWYIKLAIDFPFLFTLPVRKFLMEATFMGTARSMVRIQEYLKENGARVDNSLNNDSSVHRVHRQKVCVKREYPLESAMQVFDKSKASNACVFEFQYDGEVGTGLGPTMEFYSLVGNALQKKKLQLWRNGDEDEDSETYLTVEGLYPRAVPPTVTDRTQLKQFIRHFQFIGRYLARVLLDRRIPNMRFAEPFIKMLRGDELAFDDIAQISPKIYSLLEAMAVALAVEKKKGTTSSAAGEEPIVLSSLPKPVTIEDLALTFVLPGAEDVPLCENGDDIDVTSKNASEYLAKVSTALLKDTMQIAAKAAREGFGSVFSLVSLKLLTTPELLGIFMGSREPVTVAELDACVVCDHGYISSSKPVRMFFELLSEMPFERQCQFFQFLTGSPSLPVGGLSSLRPPMTIVRKTSGDPKVPEDSQLPSAMTCQNYLKLPAYESKEQMAGKLIQALENGGNAFHFS